MEEEVVLRVVSAGLGSQSAVSGVFIALHLLSCWETRQAAPQGQGAHLVASAGAWQLVEGSTGVSRMCAVLCQSAQVAVCQTLPVRRCQAEPRALHRPGQTRTAHKLICRASASAGVVRVTIHAGDMGRVHCTETHPGCCCGCACKSQAAHWQPQPDCLGSLLALSGCMAQLSTPHRGSGQVGLTCLCQVPMDASSSSS